MAVIASILFLGGLIAFIVASTRKEKDAVNENFDADYAFSANQLKLAAISSLLIAIGQIILPGTNRNVWLDVISSVLIGAAFILLIFAMPRKHKPPVIFFLVFVVCFFIYLYFFE